MIYVLTYFIIGMIYVGLTFKQMLKTFYGYISEDKKSEFGEDIVLLVVFFWACAFSLIKISLWPIFITTELTRIVDKLTK